MHWKHAGATDEIDKAGEAYFGDDIDPDSTEAIQRKRVLEMLCATAGQGVCMHGLGAGRRGGVGGGKERTGRTGRLTESHIIEAGEDLFACV